MWTAFQTSFVQQVDKFVLYTMNRRVPDTLQTSYKDVPAFETVLAQTAVNPHHTPNYMLSAPGEHFVQLRSMQGPIACRVRVRPARDPQAPLLIYHHGFSETPYDSSWQRLFPKKRPLPFHTVCIQAPYHDHWRTPFTKSMASIQQIYQTFAGSLRLIELMQDHFEQQGAAYTVLSGVSWGGITSLLYEGIFQRTSAIIPMLSSPNLAQVMLDIADLFNRPLELPRREVQQLLDFTPYFDRCDASRVYPLLGENDLFFRFEKHEKLFADCRMATIPRGHITGFFNITPLRQHVDDVLRQIEAANVAVASTAALPA